MELVTNCDQFGRRKHSFVIPLVFKKHGAIMAASVLNTSKAVEISLYVVRVFVRMRESAVAHIRLARGHGKIRLARLVTIHSKAATACGRIVQRRLS